MFEVGSDEGDSPARSPSRTGTRPDAAGTRADALGTGQQSGPAPGEKSLSSYFGSPGNATGDDPFASLGKPPAQAQ